MCKFFLALESNKEKKEGADICMHTYTLHIKCVYMYTTYICDTYYVYICTFGYLRTVIIITVDIIVRDCVVMTIDYYQ
jgi:hypothetical protein